MELSIKIKATESQIEKITSNSYKHFNFPYSVKYCSVLGRGSDCQNRSNWEILIRTNEENAKHLKRVKTGSGVIKLFNNVNTLIKFSELAKDYKDKLSNYPERFNGVFVYYKHDVNKELELIDYYLSNPTVENARNITCSPFFHNYLMWKNNK